MITMPARRTTLLTAVAVAVIALSAACAAPPPRRSTNVVRQIDHVLIATSEARELFALLSDTLQLPVVWPMKDYGDFASGGVAVGNVNLEVLEEPQPAAGAATSRFVGMALEPEPLRTCLPELRARRIPHGSPNPFRSRQPDGSTKVLWTTVGLPDVSSESMEVFFCEYGHDVTARRRRSLEQLQARDGGPLAVRSIREVVCGAREAKRMEEHWQTLLDPLQASSPGVWRLGAGPAIRVIPADEDGIRELVVDIESLQKARLFLGAHGLLGTERPAAVMLAGSRLRGLRVTLVEER